MEAEVVDLGTRLKDYQGGDRVVMTEAEINNITFENKRYCEFWKKKKTIAREIIELVAEGADMDYK